MAYDKVVHKNMAKEVDLPLFAHLSRQFLTISELNAIIKGTLESQLDAVWVLGEISNFRVFPSGHSYFTLKDDKCQISAVMFRQRGEALFRTGERHGNPMLRTG